MDSTAFQRVVETAERQHGVVTARQAAAILGRSRMDYWIRTGRLVRMQHATYRMAGSPDTWLAQLSAARLSARGVVSHRSAAQLWGLIDIMDAVEVSVGPRQQPRLEPPAQVHRIADLRVDRAICRVGMPLTDPRRTLVDLGLVLPPRAVADALTVGLTSKLVRLDDVRRLRKALGRPGRTGTGILGAILDRRLETDGREESVLEARFIDLLIARGLRLPVLQYEVWDGPQFVGRLDGAYPEAKLAVELESYRYHSAPEAFERDLARLNRLVTLGWTVLRYGWLDVTSRGPATADAIVSTYRRLASARGLSSRITT